MRRDPVLSRMIVRFALGYWNQRSKSHGINPYNTKIKITPRAQVNDQHVRVQIHDHSGGLDLLTLVRRCHRLQRERCRRPRLQLLHQKSVGVRD